ncbi:hexokinase type 2-like [Cylas formicarius]|uniref:hexokinase type 2-like n=1 Tax=Cylas formicarius TaxID=197179 RepID=UPI0029587E46|nr:hexokinase type 2-like [Cylas formicarius]
MSNCPSRTCNPKAGSNPIPGNPQSFSTKDWIDRQVNSEIHEAMKDLMLDNNTLKKISTLFLQNIERGLKKDTHPTSIVKCYPTYVQDLPDGTEKGKFLALDLGGTNFRVLMVNIDSDKCEMESEIFSMSNELITGSGYDLFDYIAECLAIFSKKRGVAEQNLPLGFTFSFPASQKGLSKAIVVRWTKGFDCKDILGLDVGELLTNAVNKRGDLKIDVCAILNDTTGTLMSCAFKNRDTRIGMIVGTGNNACYIEKQANAELFDEPDMGSGDVVINLECGAFGDDGALDFIRTELDRVIDKEYPNQGRQLHEKMISGMYLGELARRYILKFAQQGLILGGKTSPIFETQDSFPTSNLSEIEKDQPGSFKLQRDILHQLGLEHATDVDCINIRFISQCLTRRAAHLASTALVTLIHKMGVKKVTVGIDGSLYKYHPHFRTLMIAKMNELIDPGYTYELMLSEDGSGIGAALVAAVAAKKKRQLGIS